MAKNQVWLPASKAPVRTLVWALTRDDRGDHYPAALYRVGRRWFDVLHGERITPLPTHYQPLVPATEKRELQKAMNHYSAALDALRRSLAIVTGTSA